MQKEVIMKRYFTAIAAAALLACTALTPAGAQDNTTQEGAQEQIIKKPAANSAKEAAPGQEQKSGDTSAREAAPGQQQKAGDANASEVAPGQEKISGEATEESGSKKLKKQSQATGDESQQLTEGQTDSSKGMEKKRAEKAGSDQQSTEGETNSNASEEQETSSEKTGSIDITTEKRTEITRVFREEKSEPVTVDFDVSVGVVVPQTVTLRPVPTRVIEIVPDYRGYEYFVLADGRIIIVEPGTLKVVYVLVV
jgi:hypothetical protein